MKLPCCPNLKCLQKAVQVKRHGFYITRWNAQAVRRYRCLRCRRTFSSHTFKSTYRQKRPDLNEVIYRWYVSGTTQRRMAKVLGIGRNTVVRKFLFVASEAKKQNEAHLSGDVPAIQFDEMETFEHTRLKPLSIALAVNPENGKLLLANVAPFPCKGKLASLSTIKYGYRKDLRKEARRALLLRLQRLTPKIITTDFHPAYPRLIKKHLPQTLHRQALRVKHPRNLYHRNRRRNVRDELFSLNFVAAKIRHDLSRMARRVWVTTKKPERLQAHLDLFIASHNKYALKF